MSLVEENALVFDTRNVGKYIFIESETDERTQSALIKLKKVGRLEFIHALISDRRNIFFFR